MRIRSDILKTTATDKGVAREQLAQAVERDALKGERAVRAINNWMNGKDHPRCRAEDMTKLAGALGVARKDIAKFVSQVKYHRGSPRKAALIADMIRGKSVNDALNMLSFTTRRAAVDVKKALNAAIADAELAEADVNKLVVCESRVDQGPRMKRFQPKDRGRAHPIIKCFSHITVGVAEKVAKKRPAKKA